MKAIKANIVQHLTVKEMTISVAESCTGGSIARLITQIPGASVIFKGGIVAYTPEIKQQILGVNPNILDGFGFVSRETAMGMALGCARLFKTDWAISTTGYAGPGGGDSAHPVGTVYIAIYSPRCQKSGIWKFRFEGTRKEIMKQASEQALTQLNLMLS